MSVNVSLDEFTRVLTSCGADSSSVAPDVIRRHHNLLVSKLQGSGIYDRTTLAMFLANVMHDTDCLRLTSDPKPDPSVYWHDGRNYFGRGFIRLAYWYNYQDASEALYGDDRLYVDPDMLSRDDAAAWEAALWIWRDKVRPELLSSGLSNFDATIWAIDPSEVCEKANEADRQKADVRRELYSKVRAVLVDGNASQQTARVSDCGVGESQLFRSPSEILSAA